MRLHRPRARLALLLPTAVLATALLGPAAVPLLVCLGFLLAGWYPGEDAIERLRDGRRPAARRARPSDDAAPQLPRVRIARPGLSLAGGLVRRGPPVLVA